MTAASLFRRAALGTLAAVSLGASPAAAATYCVAPATGCDASFDTFDGALDQAHLNGGKDTILLGAATYSPPIVGVAPALQQFHAEETNPVDIVGAGRTSTLIEAPTSTESALRIDSVGSTVKDLTIKAHDPNRYTLFVIGTTLDGIAVTSAEDNKGGFDQAAILMFSGSNVLRNSTVTLPYGAASDTWAVEMNSSANNVIEDSTITSDAGVVGIFGGSTGNQIRRSRINARRGVVIRDGGAVDVQTSVIRVPAGAGDTAMALNAHASGNGVTRLTARHVTIVGNAAGKGAFIQYASACGSTGHATVVLDNVVISGFPKSTDQVSACAGSPSSPASCPDPPAAASTRLQWTNGVRDGEVPIVGLGCRGLNAVVFGSPGFVSAADLRPRQPSPLIDAGDTSPDAGGEQDLNGNPRVVEGDGAGGARRDIGAFEYQRQAPTVSASVTPGSGLTSTVFAFTATGTDLDGEELTYIWNFSDGVATTGQTVEKTFRLTGAQSGEVTALDRSGLTAKSSAAVTVTTASPGLPPTLPPPADLTGPVVSVKGGTLRVSKRRKAKLRVTCPAVETAGCQIAVAALSAKKIALPGKRRRIASLGKGSGRIAGGSAASVTITLSKAAFRYLGRKKRLPAKLTVTARDAAGNAARSSVRATFRAPRR